MSPELDKRLCERYPLVFRYRHLTSSEHTMGRGFECGDGWYALIDVACAVASAPYERAKLEYENSLRAQDSPEQVTRACHLLDEQASVLPVALQVKEKMGSLRIYFEGGDERARAASEFAELLSESVCELCGRPGAFLKDGGWLRVRCGHHELE